MARLSVIIPAYNAEKSLERCVESVISQSFTDWTITIVDDGSFDSTSAIAFSLSRSDSRIRVISQENQGPLAARLNALAGDSDMILFVDADDALASDNALEQLMALADEVAETEIVVGADNRDWRMCGGVKSLKLSCSPTDYALAMLRGEARHEMWGTIFRREFLERAVDNPDLSIEGISLTYGEDFAFMLKVLSVARFPILSVTSNIVYSYSASRKENDVWNNASFSEIENYLSCLKSSAEAFVDKTDNIKREWANYVVRFLYKYAIVRGLEFGSAEPIVREAVECGSFCGHDCEIVKMLRHSSLRRLVAKRHQTSPHCQNAVDVAAAPDVSVLIPAFNAQNTIQRALRSVLRQKNAPVFEVVVYDDGSSDSTADVVRSFSVIDSRVVLVVGMENRGLSFARTQLIAHSRGKWVQFVDADDTLEPEALSRCLAASSNADIVMMGSKICSRRFRFSFRYFIPTEKIAKHPTVTTHLLTKLLTKSGITLNVWDKMYSRNALLQSDIVAEEKFYGEDLMFNTRVFSRRWTIVFIDYIGYKWTTEGGSWLNADVKWAEDIDLAIRLCSLLRQLGIASDENTRAAVVGMENALTLAVADKVSGWLPTRFHRKKVVEWIEKAISSSALDNLMQYLPEDSALRRRDADAIFSNGCKMARRSRLGFLLKRVM